MTTSILAGFDLETTSPKPNTCAAVQVGLVEFGYSEQGVVENVIINEICDPGMDVSDGAAAIHGITPEMIAGKRADHVVLAEAYDWLKEREDRVIVMGHHCRGFDLPILNRVPQQFGHHKYTGPLKVRFIDTLVIARRVLHMAPGHKLGELYQWITGEEPVNAHDAVGDCRMVLTLVRYFAGALKMNIDELAEYCSQTRVLKICTYAKHRGKLWGRGGKEFVPAAYVRWMCDNFESPDPDLVATVREKYGLRFKLA